MASYFMAEGVGFEPTRQSPDLSVFKTEPFSRLGIPPNFSKPIFDLSCPRRPESALKNARHIVEVGIEPTTFRV